MACGRAGCGRVPAAVVPARAAEGAGKGKALWVPKCRGKEEAGTHPSDPGHPARAEAAGIGSARTAVPLLREGDDAALYHQAPAAWTGSLRERAADEGQQPRPAPNLSQRMKTSSPTRHPRNARSQGDLANSPQGGESGAMPGRPGGTPDERPEASCGKPKAINPGVSAQRMSAGLSRPSGKAHRNRRRGEPEAKANRKGIARFVDARP